jgi:hypothetical protein
MGEPYPASSARSWAKRARARPPLLALLVLLWRAKQDDLIGDHLNRRSLLAGPRLVLTRLQPTIDQNQSPAS